MPARLRLSAPFAIAALLAACSPPPPQSLDSNLWQPAPIDDRGARCADVGAVRACWSDGCPGGVCVTARPEDARASRCTGGGKDRRCTRRGRLADAFACTNGSCVQRHPRLPDDGEWTCVDLTGAVLCRGAQPPTTPDPGWTCGKRPSGERVCIDLDPDLPPGGPHRCRFDHIPRDRRICEPDAPPTPRVGTPCSADATCPEGTRCGAGRCLPPAPEPECWLPEDCAGAPCRLGRCAGPTP